MNVLDLFSGIGGFSLGLERAGMRTVAFCEIEPYCRAVLARHWPGVPIFPDVTKLKAWDVADATGFRRNGYTPRLRGISAGEKERRLQKLARGSIDVICGGFPCQDISVAGKGAGLAGARSGLWSEYHRLIGELRPRYVIVENVAALLNRGLEQVLADLASIGYDAEWHCIPASYVGAPHRRDRIWIIAYPQCNGGWSDAAGHGLSPESAQLQRENGQACSSDDTPVCGNVADTEESRLEGRKTFRDERSGQPRPRQSSGSINDQWLTEPDVGRVAHGVPSRVDRLRALGNAVVPQVVEIIGRAIMSAASTPSGGSEHD